VKNEKFAVTQQLDTPTQVLLTVVKMVPREDEAVQMLVQISDLRRLRTCPFRGDSAVDVLRLHHSSQR